MSSDHQASYKIHTSCRSSSFSPLRAHLFSGRAGLLFGGNKKHHLSQSLTVLSPLVGVVCVFWKSMFLLAAKYQNWTASVWTEYKDI